jgi:hypothetical protein
MLQGLEGPDCAAKLLALLEVISGQFQRLVHAADGLCTHRSQSHGLGFGNCLISCKATTLGVVRGVFEYDFRCAHPVLGFEITAQARITFYKKQPGFISGLRRNNKHVRLPAMAHG